MALLLTPLPGPSIPGALNVGLLQGEPRVGVIELARPQARNAFDEPMWAGFPQAVRALEQQEGVQCLVVCARGEVFCAGIDTGFLAAMMRKLEGACPGRMREHLRAQIMRLQDAYSSLEQCRWPVIAAVHGACIGGGVDLAAACDIRVCSAAASFCVKEVDLAITADLGALQRLPRIIGHGATADLALTARTISSQEALRLGLVTQVIGADNAAVIAGALAMARQIAAKSALALVGTKRVLLHARDSAGSVAAGLEYVATHNAAVMVSSDLAAVVAARGKKGPVAFAKL